MDLLKDGDISWLDGHSFGSSSISVVAYRPDWISPLGLCWSLDCKVNIHGLQKVTSY